MIQPVCCRGRSVFFVRRQSRFCHAACYTACVFRQADWQQGMGALMGSGGGEVPNPAPSAWWTNLSIVVPVATFVVTLPFALAVVLGLSPHEKGWWAVVGMLVVVVGAAPGYFYACLEKPNVRKASPAERLWVRSSLTFVGGICLMGGFGSSLFLIVRGGCLVILVLAGCLLYRFERS